MNTDSLTEVHKKIFLVSLLGFLCSLGISFSLWFPYSNIFSPTPIFESFEQLPDVVHSLISVFFIFYLILGLFAKKSQKKYLILFANLFILSLILDQLRWQPWAYYYFFIFLSLLLVPTAKKEAQLNAVRIILILIYLWSGIQKVNFTFFFNTYPWLIEPITSLLPENLRSAFNSTYLVAPIVEISAALGLLFKKTRRISAFTLIIMHLFILSMIGPFGHNTNSVVWPWNITFSILLYLLFLRRTNFSFSGLLKKRIHSYQIIILILFGLMPALSFFDSWPMFFSSALYSGNKIESKIYIPDQFKEELPEYIQQKTEGINNSTRLMFFIQNELNVPIYPTKEFHLKSFKKLCTQYPQYSIEFVLVNYSKPNLISGEKTKETYFCDDID